MSLLGFTYPGDNIKLDRKTFLDKIEKTRMNCELFTQPKETKKLFGMSKAIITSVKSFLGFVNSIFHEWGIVVKCKRHDKRIKIDGKGKTIHEYYYSLQYFNDMNNYL